MTDLRRLPPFGDYQGQFVPSNRRPQVGDDCSNDQPVWVNGVMFRVGAINGTAISVSDDVIQIQERGTGAIFSLPAKDVRKGHGVQP